MNAALRFVFFLSGAAALLFESLWFRQALLAFGSSIWASSLVLSSFMAGIALGNAGAARFGTRVRHPVRAYAVLELLVGGLGFALVLSIPQLGPLLVPVFRPVLANDALLQPLRFVFGFAVLLGPACAMGATLPLLVRALGRRPQEFGGALGALYGWNTLGAVVGALVGELALLSLLGVMRTAAVAAGLNLLSALGALAIARARPEIATVPAEAETAAAPRAAIAGRPARLLLATFLAGGLLLALEVVWFRLLVLFVGGTSLAFACMLAVVLAGIGLGSLVAGLWLQRAPDADRHAIWVALAAGAFAMLTYGQLDPLLGDSPIPLDILSGTGVAVAALLMLPVAAASGLLFPLLGKALNDALRQPVRSAGLLTLVNTLGAAGGPLLAGFVLLPRLGVEHSLLLLGASYAAVAVLAARPGALQQWRGIALPALGFAAAIAAFPFGRMEDTYLERVSRTYLWADAAVIARREGVAQTLQLTRLLFLDEPVGHQLITDAYSMSSTSLVSQRYMSLFAYLPAGLQAAPRDALLISYGVGTTLRSLTRIEGMRSIDVVDISREILDMSDLIFPPAENPLDDPRVRVHIEDGRYFLQTTDRSFDLITGEPPPPRAGNVSYLYTQEYFQLAHDRLRSGGLVSYWLPVDQLSAEEGASITGAFCAVFEDCTLWNGSGLNWILLGSRGGIEATPPGRLERLWQHPPSGRELRAVGVERPAALGALFIGDARQLRRFTDLAPPVRDDFPLRIHNRLSPSQVEFFAAYQSAPRCRARFLSSLWVRGHWPKSLRRETLDAFRETGLVDRTLGKLAPRDEAFRLQTLRMALEESDLETLPLWAQGVDRRRVEIARRRRDAGESSGPVERALARDALARRDWSRAADHFRAAAVLEDGPVTPLASYAACRAGDRARVAALRAEIFAPGSEPALPPGSVVDPGIDGCWAAAWDRDWVGP